MLEKEIKQYSDNLKNWLTCREGLFVLIKDDNITFFNTFEDALTEGAKRYGLDYYLIRVIAEKQEEIVVPALTLGLLHADIS